MSEDEPDPEPELDPESLEEPLPELEDPESVDPSDDVVPVPPWATTLVLAAELVDVW